LEAISVKYTNKFIPKLILPALSMGIFLEYFFIKSHNDSDTTLNWN